MTEPIAFDRLLAQSWALFKQNWIVAAPPLIAGGVVLVTLAVLAAFAAAALTAGKDVNHPSGSTIVLLVGAYLLFAVVALPAAWWAVLAQYGMADAVWLRGTTGLREGTAAFRARWAPSFVAVLGLTGLAIAALILALPTLGIALLALPLFTMYVVPSVVGGGRRGFAAISESFRLVRRFFLPSLIVLLVLFAIQFGIGMIGGIGMYPLEFSLLSSSGKDAALQLPPLPLLVFAALFYLASLVAGIAYSGFYAIALTGMYRALAAQPQAPPPAGEIVAT